MNSETNVLVVEFLDYLKIEKGLSENTVKSYRVDLYEFFKIISKSYEKIEKEDIYTYIDNMRNKFKNNTVQRKVSAVKTFFKYLYMNKKIKKDPLNTIKLMKKETRLPEIIDEEEFNKIIETFNHNPKDVRDKLILKLLMASGARISEIVNLDVSNIKDNDYRYIKVLGKGSKYRFIPIYDKIADEIKEYIEKEREEIKSSKKDYKLFPGASRTTFYLKLREKAKNAGINKNVHPHTIRHSVASLLLKNGLDIRYVQELLGHSSITTTEHYTHVEKSKLKSIYDNVGLGDDVE
ncbi:tyrosine-type recombinase/integrase [Oceanivirga miroungae]|uniref:Type 1 fimbriae Regulatory protein fimB n=1 Tax=Oceanivirga miroungae TaxID=1130046 RepID=A0A6I8MCF6_9FUSO|nr:tyrosine-type recombinase/integrase [Oceanivirga miroungae]VWL85151.1 Type 1 fimbriae Regulatory protein fimB [Oceanivirga miroungae]